MNRAGIFTLLWIALMTATSGTAQVSFSESDLPIIVIETNGQTIPDEPKITATMGIIYNGPGVVNHVSDPHNNYNGYIGIELRGSTSQFLFPKKQYGIELRNAVGSSIDASLLGLPKKDDWVLFAPYNDKTLMRDVLAYKLGRDQSRYASRFRYCELVLNGEYMGVFVLLEKIKRDKNRVAIDKLDVTENSGDNLTGGYIIKIDKVNGGGGLGWYSAYPPRHATDGQTIFFQYEYPKQEDITPEQKEYIRQYFNSFENALIGDDFQDPVKGYPAFIDVDSFVDFFIASELTKNPDAYRISTFMHKRKDSDGGKLFMGPIWDFNLGFGNVNYCTREYPEGFVIDFNRICPNDYWQIPFWWDRLFADVAFREKVTTRWQTLRQGVYQTDRVMAFIDSVSTVLKGGSSQRNFQRWPVLGQWIWPNPYVGQTFDDEVIWLKNWLGDRLEWLDTNIPLIITAVETRPAFVAVLTPNPAHERATLHVNSTHDGTLLVTVSDISGKEIRASSYSVKSGLPADIDLETGSLPPGMYLVRLKVGTHQEVLKLIR